MTKSVGVAVGPGTSVATAQVTQVVTALSAHQRGGQRGGTTAPRCGWVAGSFSNTPQLGIKPATQAYALIRTQTCNLPLCRTTANPLSHTGQGSHLLLSKGEGERLNAYESVHVAHH